jgi:GntR family transcriptional regulator
MIRDTGTEGSPRYLRIARELRARIESGAYADGFRMPTEAELCDAFRVSRITVRQALALLERERLVSRERGRGTFARRRLVRDLKPLYSFMEDMRRAGREPTSVLLSSGEAEADGDEIERLALDPARALVHRLVRLRVADGIPVLLERTSLPAALVPGFALADPARDSLYATLAERYGLAPAAGTETYEAVILSAEEAGMLGVAGPGPRAGMAVTRVAGLADGRPLELTRSVGPAERMVFSLSI